MVLNYIYIDRIDPTQNVEDPTSNRIVLLVMDVYRLAVQFDMKRLEQLCVQYLETTISYSNVLKALHNAAHLKLYFIKEFCLSFIVKDSNFNQIVMSQEFETLEQPLMVEIIRRRTTPQTRNIFKQYYQAGSAGCTTLEEDMEAFLKHVGREFCDITLVLDGKSIPAHKAVLAARCSYFEAMFRYKTLINNL